jgi:hypothetical protein
MTLVESKDEKPSSKEKKKSTEASRKHESMLEMIVGRFGFPVIGLGFAGFLLVAPVGFSRGSLEATIVAVGAVGIAMISLSAGLFAFLQTNNSLRSEEFSLSKFSIESGAAFSTQPRTELGVDEREEIVDAIKKAMTAEATQELSEIWKKEFRDKDASKQRDDELLHAAKATMPRLSQEIVSLRSRANLNLAVGASVSLIGIVVLTGFIYLSTAELATLSATDVAIRFAVRISLAIFIQVLAYFFLRLYRSSLFEIKYFQNEATSAQFRLLGLLTALKLNDPKIIEKVCTELLKTERNFVLKKGETTVGLQRETIERDYDAQLTKMLEAVLARSKATA